ncbi:hypothetical protein KCP74_24065 [Salmonella enterica subsp. enterica]|nr:hypothetical protein KCP74_24065 [Salmonella enterica subsp. enterica]
MALKRLIAGPGCWIKFTKLEAEARQSAPMRKRDTDKRERRHVRTEHCQY